MDLGTSLDAFAAESGFSGVVRIDRGSSTVERAYGQAHRGLAIANTTNTRFAIASGGKGFTALAVASLIEDGTLALDTRARSILGRDLPLIDDGVTVEHLLGHRSGIGDYLDEEDESLDATDYVLRSPVHLLVDTEAFVAELDGFATKFPPGDRFSYCNGGYVVLALLAERSSGVRYHDLVRERVIEPAQLTDTDFLRSDEPADDIALGYLGEHGLRTNVFHLPVRGNGDGGIYTTAADLRRLWEAFFAGSIVSSSAVDLMTRPHSVAIAEKARYGLGFWLDATGPQVSLVGGDAGVSFTSTHDPTTGDTWSVLANSTDGAWPMVRWMAQLDG